MSSGAVPPHYSDGQRHELSIAWPAAWVAALGSSLLLAGHELAIARPRIFLDASWARATTLGAVVALAAGLAAGLRVRRSTAPLLVALSSLSALASGSGYLSHLGFARGSWLAALVLSTAVLSSALVGACSGIFYRSLWRALSDLGILTYLLNPLRVLLLVIAWILVTLALPWLGVLRGAALLGTLLAALAVSLPTLRAFMAGEWRAWPWQSLALTPPALGAVAALLGAESIVPLADLRNHSGDVVFVLDSARGRHVLTRLQSGAALFSNDLLATTSADARRFAEALAHPALALSSRASSVLVFSNGLGAIEREVLRWPGVHVTSVYADGGLAELARRASWMRSLGAGALDARRITRVQAEPFEFLARDRGSYDVVLADFGDPLSYLEGKHYTRHFFRRLRERFPQGVLALQVSSPLRTPATHESILATLRAAELDVHTYRAPLPTLGEWGFALAAPAGRSSLGWDARISAARPLPTGTVLLTDATLPALFAANEALRPRDVAVSYLFDQPLVELYLKEEQALSGVELP
jgi:spermidine synthase